MQVKEIKGTPPFKTGTKTGYFLWKDTDGIHLQWTAKGGIHGFQGTITSDKPINLKEVTKLEGNDKITQEGTNRISWETRTKSDIDGLIFEAEGNFTLELKLDNNKIGLNQIFCGIGLRHPLSNPYTVILI